MTHTDTATASVGTERGAARTTGEQAVERALDAVPQWRGRRAWYTPVYGGLQNENWRVDVDGEDASFFLKVPGAGSETFIDRGNSHVAAERAGALGISPRIVHFDPSTGVEIIEFLDGYRACTNGDMKRPEIASEIIGLYRAFGSAEALPSTKTIIDMIEEHRAQAADLGVRLPSFWPALLREYRAARSALTAGGLDIVPCHNDPMPGNFLIAEGRPMRLVDFEFSSNNERAYELAVMATEFFYDDRRFTECVEEFYGAAEWSTLARVQVCSFLADVKWGLWGCVNAQLNDGWDYDYHKYGVWKLRRAQTKMTDPRWGGWLGAL
ncbi:choline/ethanolamine kinase family protein [Microbacterium trichothecenolyticum]|uniref:Thiamine kinase-like enzyme n=1 Tax=Microbacterium trichothecenolyticum TaxID=69370 RepID=A0ABU0TWU4_MICTR|nr:choline/ethanolamine kinase family protein [Microbacterium trichothecenolyticum]MDQ1124133.1 thiamine kinase-like enzyme [Microbacterium trichothecenolyticum]